VAAPEALVSNLTPSKGRVRPLNAIGPVAGSVFTVLAWAAIAHNSGSGWVQALGVVLGSVLLVGLVGPGRFASRARVSVESSPTDAVAGEPFEVSISASARVRVRPVSPPGKTRYFGPRGAHHDRRPHGDDRGPHGEIVPGGSSHDAPALEVVPNRRGVLVSVTVDIASAAPFGLVWWSRRATLALPVEVFVAPRPTKPFTIPPEGDHSGDEEGGGHSASFGATRGVRDYEHGDARRTVHWRASAHTGRLMVREMEMPSAEPVIVRIALPSDQAAGDELAGRGLATVHALLDRSRPVMLATHEPDGYRLAQVTGATDAGRRLARAVANGPGPGSVTIDDPSDGTRPSQSTQSFQHTQPFQNTQLFQNTQDGPPWA
jgi:uncharacterized protein (DUF58 family)